MVLYEKLTRKDIRRLYGVEIHGASSKFSSCGGLLPFIEYLKKARIRERLESLFGQYKARSVLQLCIGFLLGADDLDECERLCKDPLVRDFLRNPVTATQLGRDYKSFSDSEIQAFHEFVMSLSILELVDLVPHHEDLIIDIDQTAVEKFGSQEGVSQGYVSRDNIKYCYQYLFVRLANLNTFLYGTVRDGSCHSQHDFCGYLNQFLPFFKGSQRPVRLRCDSGYFNEAAFEICTENRIFFYIKAPMSTSRLSQATADGLIWNEDPDQPEVSYASYETVAKGGAIWREVFKRTTTIEPGALFPFERYDCIATNDLEISEKDTYSFYNGRANIENNIKELKNDYSLGSIVTGKFSANDVITQTTLMTYILVQHFKRVFLDKDQHRIQLSTMRWKIFNMVGRKVRSARKQVVKLYSVFIPEEKILHILYRLKVITTCLMKPPILT